MATVLNDNEAFKITLQIVEDFINDDYDAFIENGPTDDIKLITWELVIYFKKLESKKKTIVEYYMNPIYKHIKKGLYFYYDGHYRYTGQSGNYYNDLTIDFEKNISNKIITIKFICDETRKDIPRKTGYINQIDFILKYLMGYNGGGGALMCNDYNTRGYYKTIKEIKGSPIDLLKDKSLPLKDIVKDHYSEILKNIEAYILYCKTEKIDIDFKKIAERIRYIKEYVKENYDIALV